MTVFHSLFFPVFSSMILFFQKTNNWKKRKYEEDMMHACMHGYVIHFSTSKEVRQKFICKLNYYRWTLSIWNGWLASGIVRQVLFQGLTTILIVKTKQCNVLLYVVVQTSTQRNSSPRTGLIHNFLSLAWFTYSRMNQRTYSSSSNSSHPIRICSTNFFKHKSRIIAITFSLQKWKQQIND